MVFCEGVRRFHRPLKRFQCTKKFKNSCSLLMFYHYVLGICLCQLLSVVLNTFTFPHRGTIVPVCGNGFVFLPSSRSSSYCCLNNVEDFHSYMIEISFGLIRGVAR